jgi:hypothetical protein
MTHTPGPWKVADRTGCGEGFSVIAPRQHWSRSGVAHFTSEEDARLISVAPELLEMALDLWADYSATDDQRLLGIALRAREAIEAAQARQQAA